MEVRSTIVLVAAVANNRVIGRNNKLPWSIPTEMRKFQDITDGRVMVMGANTAFSIGPALKGRPCFVIANRNISQLVEWGYNVCSNLEGALEHARSMAVRVAPMRERGHPPRIYVIGGAKLYEELLPIADELMISNIDLDVPDGDAFFPKADPTMWDIRYTTSVNETEASPAWIWDHWIHKKSTSAVLRSQLNMSDIETMKGRRSWFMTEAEIADSRRIWLEANTPA